MPSIIISESISKKNSWTTSNEFSNFKSWKLLHIPQEPTGLRLNYTRPVYWKLWEYCSLFYRNLYSTFSLWRPNHATWKFFGKHRDFSIFIMDLNEMINFSLIMNCLNDHTIRSALINWSICNECCAMRSHEIFL